MRENLPTGTVTFLFTDVEGSTRLLHELGVKGYAVALAEHRRLIRQACASEGGVEVDTQGDAFFFAFPTAPGALAAASAFTEALSPGPIHVRVGLHTGTPLLTEGGYVGGDVHRAARIAACGHGGQVLVSSSMAQLVDLELADLGEHRLKDLSAPERVFQLGDREFPTLKSLYRTNLPVPATPFLGREQELAELLSLLSSEDTRLLTLTGPGGTGKTRLALQAVAEASDRYAEGVWWVPLAPLREPALVFETAAQVLGSKNGLAEHIADKSMLCLFDNFEQVVEAGAELASLLASCPNLDFVVTSRERLRVRGEQTYPVPPLAEEDGEALFIARARAVDPAFTSSEAVAELCLRLDELPLALELAAARTALFSPEQLLERLSQRLDLLKGERDADPRQQTLRATIEWSHDLLSTREQVLFARLSVFAGGCSYEAAEQIAEADPDTLQSLLDKSLLRRRESPAGPRYWMLETIREFARHALDAATERELNERHADYYVALGEEAEPHLRVDPKDWLDLIDAELDNFRGALDYLETADASRQLRLAASLGRFWVVRGHVAEGRRRIERALAVAPLDSVDVRVEALQRAAELARVDGAYTVAKRLTRESLELARGTSDWYRIGAALHTLANIALAEGDLDAASALLDEALEPQRLAGDKRALAIVMSTRGYLALSRTDYEAAAARCQESLALATEIENDECMILALLNLGLATLGLGRLDDASLAFVRGLRLATSLGWKDWASYAQEGMAAVAAARGRTDEALRALAWAIAMREEIGTHLDPVEQEVHDKTLDIIRASFSQEAIEAAIEEARQLTEEEAWAWAHESLA